MRLGRVLVVSKRTRLEFASTKFGGISGKQLEDELRRGGFPHERIVTSHFSHHDSLDQITRGLTRRGCDVRLVRAPALIASDLENVDAVFTAGGDGTVLETAARIKGSDIPVISINTDPNLSHGFLCSFKLNDGVSFEEGVLDKLRKGEYSPLYRSRLQVRLGDDYPLPQLALNEIFFAERDASRPTVHETYLESTKEKLVQRSSGVIISTGTGSTAWMSSASMVSRFDVSRILDIGKSYSNYEFAEDEIDRVAKKLHEEGVFPADSRFAQYCIREPVLNGWYGDHDELLTKRPRRGLEEFISLKSLAWDGVMTFDGIEQREVPYAKHINIQIAPKANSLFTVHFH